MSCVDSLVMDWSRIEDLMSYVSKFSISEFLILKRPSGLMCDARRSKIDAEMYVNSFPSDRPATVQCLATILIFIVVIAQLV